MSPTSIAKARLRLEAASVRVAAIEVETAAEIVVAAAVGRVAAVVVVDAGGVVVVAAAADGTAVADTAADDTRGQTFGSHLKWAGSARTYLSASWSCDFGRGSFFAVVHVGGIAKETCIETRWGYVNRQFPLQAAV